MVVKTCNKYEGIQLLLGIFLNDGAQFAKCGSPVGMNCGTDLFRLYIFRSGCANDEVCASGAQAPGFEARHPKKQSKQYRKNIRWNIK